MEKIKSTYSEKTNIYTEVVKQLKNGSKKRNEIVTDLERTLKHTSGAIRNAIAKMIDAGIVQIQEMPNEENQSDSAILALNPEFEGDAVSDEDVESLKFVQ